MIKEIQGLRSISVFLILFFHLNISYFKLGYLAVDIFFVISGIIFSKIIFTHLNNNNFSIFDYSKRRIRRLFPGLIILVIIVTIISWLYLIPSELKYYGQSLFSTSLFISNIYFYIVNNDYFSPNSYSLLHLWSLSLELQFYTLYPLLVLFIHSFSLLRKNLNFIFFLIFIVSFSANIFFSYDEKFIFYLLPTRLWEFIIGYFIFLFINQKQKNNFFKQNIYLNLILSILIFYLIFGTLEFIKNQTFIIILTFIVFFITYNKKNILNAFLVNPFNQIVAKYSYIIFLVHYPIIYFFEYFGYNQKNIQTTLIIILTIIIFTILFISLENIFFKKNDNFKKEKINFLVIILIITSFTGLFFHQSKGVKLRYFLNNELNSEYIFQSIHYNTSQEINGENCNIVCKKIIGNDKTILLFGDSHAGDFEFELTQLLNKKKINLYLSYLNFAKTKIDDFEQLSKVINKEKIDFVFLIHHKREDNSSYLQKLETTLKKYKDVKFYYFLPRIEFFEPPMKYKLLNRSVNDIKKINWDQNMHWVNTTQLLYSLNFPNFKIIDQNKILLKINNSNCTKVECFDAHDPKNFPLYRDRHHFTNYGSNLFLRKLFNELSFN